jgi:hypothetical protein
LRVFVNGIAPKNWNPHFIKQITRKWNHINFSNVLLAELSFFFFFLNTISF